METRDIKILAIDDNQDNLISIKALIKEAFPKSLVYCALNGFVGLELAAAELPDVILLDIIMPGMDGFEVCTRLKSDEKLHDIPVVFVTAIKGDKEHRIKALECGAEAFLAKPIDESELTAQIRAMVRIKWANIEKSAEKERLSALVAEQTRELKETNKATLGLLDDLRKENDARKKSEEALQRNEERFRNISDSISEMSYSCKIGSDGIHQMDWIDGACEKITGCTKDELIAMGCWGKLVVEDDFPVFKKHILEVRPGFSDMCQLRIKNIKGNIVWIQASSKCVKEPVTGKRLLFGGISDITKLKLAEEALHRSDIKHGKMVANIGDVIVVLDKVGINLYKSPNSERFFGWRPEEVVGISIWENIHPGDLEALQGFFTGLVDIAYSKGTAECRYRCKDKNYKWIEISMVNLLHDPEIGGLLGNYHDITKRKQAEQKLQHVARLYALLGQINQAIVRIRDQDELFRAICQVAIEFGQFRMAWIGLADEADKKIKPFAYAGVEDGYLDKVEITIGDSDTGKGPSGMAFLLEEIITCNDIAIESKMLPWRDEALIRGYRSSVAVPFRTKGKMIGTLNLYALEPGFFCEDEQKLLKEIGEDISFALDAISSETDRKNAELELIAARDKAEESDRLKSAFLANMSHEIRTPMNGILGFAGLLKEPRLTGEEQQEYITIIEKSGARMLNIINDIITISKVESGQMKISVSQTNVNELIEYIYTFFKPEADQKGVQLFFKKSLPAKDAIIKTDKEKVYAILTNLVKNAIKYSDDGAIEIGYCLRNKVRDKACGDKACLVSTPDEMDTPDELEFFVKDTGIGIPKDRQEAIFDRFVQADIADKRAFQGAGLGLSISKAYVEMLGGKMMVDSDEGKGSTFYFTIPYNYEKQVKGDKNNIQSNEGTESQMDADYLGIKILIAEDDEISGRLLTLGIKKFGKEILNVRTGVEAVDTCLKNPDIDLVMMDIKMPEMDGYEATRQIRQFNKDVVIVAQTAYALSGDREKALAVGCNDYIAKPFGNASLRALMRKHF